MDSTDVLGIVASAVFLARLAGFERAEAAELALHRHAHRMRHLAGAPRDFDVVLVARRRLGVLAQRAVHHHAGEAGADGLHAHRRAGAVVLVQHDGDVGVHLGRGLDHLAQEGLAGVLSGAGRGLPST